MFDELDSDIMNLERLPFLYNRLKQNLSFQKLHTVLRQVLREQLKEHFSNSSVGVFKNNSLISGLKSNFELLIQLTSKNLFLLYF